MHPEKRIRAIDDTSCIQPKQDETIDGRHAYRQYQQTGMRLPQHVRRHRDKRAERVVIEAVAAEHHLLETRPEAATRLLLHPDGVKSEGVAKLRERCHELGIREEEAERVRRYDANEKAIFAAFVAFYPELVPDELYRDILWYPTQHILRHWDRNAPTYDSGLFCEGTPYAFEYFLWLIPFIRDKVLADRLVAILRQNPTAFMEAGF